MSNSLTEIVTSPVIVFTLVLSTFTVLISNSWLVVWVALELNTLAFCSMLINSTHQNRNIISEAAINYFIIQSTASAVIILYLSSPDASHLSNIIFLSGTTAILVNLASAPFHNWFLEITPNISINMSIVLITWQNLAPIYILIFIINPIILISILISSTLGSLLQITNNNIIEILALSSVFNLSWMILASLTNTQSLFIFILTYWLILIALIATLENTNTQEITSDNPNSISPWTILLLMAGLAGLPPSLGFYANLQVALQAVNTQINELTSLLLVISATNFYIYLRIGTPTIISAPANQQNNKENNNFTTPFFITLNILPIIILTL